MSSETEKKPDDLQSILDAALAEYEEGQEEAKPKEQTPRTVFAPNQEELQATMTALVDTINKDSEGSDGAAGRAEAVFNDKGLQGGESAMVAALLGPLVSKEALYGPLSQMRDRYPQWLEGQKDKLSPEEYRQREEQLRILRKVCEIYEEENCNERLGEIIVLVESMGQMPEELVDATSGSGQPGDCCVM